MKHLNNYILEKLHISRTLRKEVKINGPKDMIDYINDNNCICDEIANDVYKMFIKDKKDNDLYITLRTTDNCFVVQAWDSTNKGKLVINKPSPEYVKVFNVSDFDFDIKSWGNYKVYDYTQNNADILIDLLHDEATK